MLPRASVVTAAASARAGGGGVRYGAALIATLGLLVATLVAPAAAEDVLVNGDLSKGSGNSPTDWRTDKWDTSAGATEFLWKAPSGGEPGQAGIQNVKPNDARFVQDVRVKEQTWYHIHGKVRTKEVGEGAIGAYLSLMEGFQNSQDVKGTNADWVPIEMWVKTEKWQDRLQIALRLGGYSSLNTGEAWFSDVKVEAVSGPAPNAKNVFQPTTRGGGIAPLGLWGLILALGLIAAALWWYLRQPPGGEDRGSTGEKLALVGLLLGGLAVKIAVAPYFGFDTDLGTYAAWALRLAQVGPADFYAPNYFCDYPPGYLYVLWLLGHVYDALNISTASGLGKILLKFPAFLFDLLTTWLLYVLLRPRAGKRVTWLIVLAYALNPAVFFNSAIWGQTDSYFTLQLFLGVALLYQRQIAFGWAIIVLAALTKPQALIYLPLLASWGVNWDKPERPVIASVASLITATFLVLPFLEPLELVEHYRKGAAYYAETSVNAFNLMAILGGFRQSDSAMLGPMSYQAWAFIFVVLFFAFLALLLWRRRDGEMYVYLCFLLPFGFFMLSTRMHERYLFPCILFLSVLLPRRPRLWILYVGLTVTYYLNLWYILDALNAERFLAAYEPFGIAVSVANCGLFVWACIEAWMLTSAAPEPLPLPGAEGEEPLPAGAAVPAAAVASPVAAGAMARVATAKEKEKAKAKEEKDRRPAPPAKRPATLALWEREADSPIYRITRLDLVIALVLMLIAGALRFYDLGEPNELVFDEVYFVEQGKNYLRGKEFMDPHPPFAKLAIAASVWMFGGEANGYRILNAVCGTLLVGIAYLSGRKLLGSTLAATITGAAVAFDGLFIVDSRTAVIDIWYVTFGAIAYLLLFQYLRTPPVRRRPTILVFLGVSLGLCLGSKLFIPAFTWVTVVLFLTILSIHAARLHRDPKPWMRGLAPSALVTAVAAATYLSVYLPHYWLGWWTSIGDIPKYFQDVIGYEAAVADATHPYSSKWWSWPFLLRPIWYHFKDVPGDSTQVIGVWGGGNPLIWWGGFAAFVVILVRAVRERQLVSLFIVAAFVLHYVVWSWIGRTLFQYHYLPSLYASILALAMVLTALWSAPAEDTFWTAAGAALLLPILPTLMGPFPVWGALAWALLAGLYGAAIVYRRLPTFQWAPGRVVVVAYALIGLTLTAYFYPIWAGTPVPRSVYSSRMWFQSGPARWI